MALEGLKECTRCKISSTRKKVVEPSWKLMGDTTSGMIITDMPTKREDLTGEFSDTYWKLVDSVLKDFNKSLPYYHVTSVIRCCPETNRYPSEEEIKNCMSWLLQEITMFKPKAVIFFGEQCAKQFIKVDKSLINCVFETRMSPRTLVTYNPKALRRNTDNFISFKSAIRQFIRYSLV